VKVSHPSSFCSSWEKWELHQKIQCDGENRIVSVFLTVSCHQEKQQYYDKIPGIKIFREQLPQKIPWFLGFVVTDGAFRFRTRWCNRWGRGRVLSPSVSPWFRHFVSCVGAIRLWDISVIQSVTSLKALWRSLPFLRHA
jgi:hypothetical protein